MTLRFLLFVSILLSSFSSFSKETISWQTYHRPPSIIKMGPNKDKGFVQKTLKLITNEMPEYNHIFPTTTLARAISDIKAGNFSCHPALFITDERKKHMVFSHATMNNPTNRIIAKPKTVAPYLENGQVNLTTLLQQPNLTLAHIKNRSYGDIIDDIVLQNAPITNLFQLQSTELSRVFKMIELERVELTIAYPFEINHYLKNNPTSASQLAVYQIKSVPSYNTGAVGCPNNAWGRSVIKKVNLILKKLKPTQAYKDALLTWRDNERKSAVFEQFYNNVFLKN